MAKKEEVKKTVAIAGDTISDGLVLPSEEVVKMRFAAMCTERFPTFDALVTKLNTTTVTNDVTLDTAERTIKEATAEVNKIEAFRKEKGDPFRLVVDTINSYSNGTYKDTLNLAKANAVKRVSDYRIVQAALEKDKQKKATEEANKLELQLVADRKTVDGRIKMASAKVFGGTYIKSNGDPINYPMLSTVEDCRSAITMFSTKYPTAGVDESLQPYLRVIRDLSVRIIKDMIDILTRDEDVANRISAIKQQFDEEVEITRNRIGIKIEKTVSAVTKESTKSFNSMNKGIKVSIDWKVVDISKVPAEFLQINEAAIRAYTQNDNRKTILDKIKEGKGDAVIDGIQFVASSGVVVR